MLLCGTRRPGACNREGSAEFIVAVSCGKRGWGGEGRPGRLTQLMVMVINRFFCRQGVEIPFQTGRDAEAC